MTPSSTAAIERSVSVPIPVEEAFRVFTEQIGAWWPLATFSLGGDDAESAHVEPRVGGRIFERGRDGGEQTWATITDWQPPLRLAATWQLSSNEAATEVVVEFTPADGGTIVRLTHGGWDRVPDGASGRANYDRGWGHILGLFAGHAAAAA